MIEIRPPCLLVDERILPAIRREVAKILVNERGYSQKRAAELLGVTQAMVSKYLSKHPKHLGKEMQREIDGLALRLVEVIESPGQATRTLCSFCLSLRESSGLCPMHKRQTGNDDCNACMNLRMEDNPRNSVLHMMEGAIGMLIKENIVGLVPEVRTNIAMCTESPSGPFDVASIPGRLIVVRGKVMSPTAPEFNASRHTTNLLLRINGLQQSIKSIMNISHSEEILAACKALGLKERLLFRNDGNLVIGDLDPMTDLLIDKGAFGIEPCIYLVGRDALDVARKAVEISRALAR
ncbi:MAG: hypothetical protein JW825_02060 [Candidatus Methanofastidiosa archaeon]|nr:hypothetical protein [Candidatus Methanofastidiosa archaeon]